MIDIPHIKETRRKLGLTQKQLAHLAGVSQSLIAKIEAQRIDPAYSKVQAIFQALDDQMHKTQRVVLAKQIMTKPLLAAGPQETLEKAIDLMRKKAISQLPVLERGHSIGSISDEKFVDWMEKYGDRISRVHVREAMDESFPVVPSSARLEVITSLLRHYKAVLVKEGETIQGIITKADLIKVIGH
jgi:predicted transcriptional regulator